MTSLTQDIWTYINEDVVIRRAIEKDIISQKSLAVYLIRKHRLEASVDAVISAIRRYKESRPIERQFETAKKVLAASTDIRITSNIINISIEKNRKIQESLQKAFSLADYEKGELLLVIQGERSIKLLINERNKGRVLSAFPERSIIHVEDNLAQINILLSDTAMKTPGIVATLSTELMLYNINIFEMMSCLPELLFFVRQKDVVQAYQVLFEMCKA